MRTHVRVSMGLWVFACDDDGGVLDTSLTSWQGQRYSCDTHGMVTLHLHTRLSYPFDTGFHPEDGMGTHRYAYVSEQWVHGTSSNIGREDSEME
jgi:hypothetical protein